MDRVSCHLLHLRVHLQVEVEVRVALLHEGVQLLVGDLVALLEPPVVRQVLLHCVVGEVYRPRTDLKCVLGTGGADVAVAVPISLHLAVYAV